jgi:hypothetical protein
MKWRRRSILQVVLLGALAVLAFPGEGSALRPVFVISLTPAGPSPAVLSVPAGLGQVWFSNTDTVTHAVVFADGSCSLQVAPGTRSSCASDDFWDYVGDYAYTVDGTSQAQVVVAAVRRSISLTARSHAIGRGSRLRLHGRLREENSNWSPPSAGSPQPIIVLARPDRRHAFHRIAVVMAKLHPRTKNAPFGELLWQLRVRPRTWTTYIAEAASQPRGGQVWRQARSSPFTVRVRR